MFQLCRYIYGSIGIIDGTGPCAAKGGATAVVLAILRTDAPGRRNLLRRGTSSREHHQASGTRFLYQGTVLLHRYYIDTCIHTYYLSTYPTQKIYLLSNCSQFIQPLSNQYPDRPPFIKVYMHTYIHTYKQTKYVTLLWEKPS